MGVGLFNNPYAPDGSLIQVWIAAIVTSLLLLITGKLRGEEQGIWNWAVLIWVIAVLLSFAA